MAEVEQWTFGEDRRSGCMHKQVCEIKDLLPFCREFCTFLLKIEFLFTMLSNFERQVAPKGSAS